MEPAMDVSALVAQMQETLGAIHSTLASFDPSFHETKLEELEKKRGDAVHALSVAFDAESEALAQKRKIDREQIVERRRREDEERERKRREEDDEIAAREREEDEGRSGKLKEETEEIERDMDNLMDEVEEEAHLAISEGQEKLKALQERRRELNRLIEEQLEKALPTLQAPVAPTRGRRRSSRTSASRPVMPAIIKQFGTPNGPEPNDIPSRDKTPRSVPEESYVVEQSDKHDEAPKTGSGRPNSTTERLDHASGAIEPAGVIENLAQAEKARSEADESPVLGIYDGQSDAPSQMPTPSTIVDAETSEAPWPLPNVTAKVTSNLVHELTPADLGFQQSRPCAPERSLDKDLTSDVNPEVGNIPGTMSHGADVAGTEQAEAGTGLLVGKRDSSGNIHTERAEPGAPLPGEKAVQPVQAIHAGFRGHDSTTPSPVTEKTGSQDSSNIATAIHSPVPEGTAHRPQVLTAVNATIEERLAEDEEETFSATLPAIKPREEDLYSPVSPEVSGPARAFQADDSSSLSGYLSEDADVQDHVFNHPGEPYLEESDVGGTEHLHPGVPEIVEEKDEIGHENLSRSEEATAEVDLEIPEWTAEGDEAEEKRELIQDPAEESKHMGCDEEPNKSGALLESDHEAGSEPDHQEAPESDSHGMPQPLATEHADIRALTPKPSGSGLGSPEAQAPTTESESEGSHKGGLGEKHAHSRSPSPVRYAHYGTSPEPSEHGQQPGEDYRHERQSAAALEGHTSSEGRSSEESAKFEHFVTPLPSHQSLREFNERQADAARGVSAGHDMGNQHQAEAEAQRYELEHQHATTVHGEDHLFEDDDQSEDLHSHQEEATAGNAPDEQSTPLQPRSPEHKEETHLEHEHAEGNIPELTVHAPTSPGLVSLGSSAEEVDHYFNDEEWSRSRPGTPQQQQHETPQRSEPHEGSLTYFPPEPSSPPYQGYATSRHDTERPHTPIGQESPALSDHSPPAEHPIHAEETETKSPTSLMSPWRHRQSSSPRPPHDSRHSIDTTTSEDHKGSLFQRMRNIFEQPRSSKASSTETPPPNTPAQPTPALLWAMILPPTHFSPTSPCATTASKEKKKTNAPPLLTHPFFHAPSQGRPAMGRALRIDHARALLRVVVLPQ
ncbi:hypothetical protein N0V88_007046 [Collariella sp. IMI 366227]|nr:hypothetical protein N0V88_007046 [Collariella sp. IMI 366227]